MQSPSWEANWSAASQEIPRISRNPKVRYHPHKRPPPLSILGQPNSVHIPTSHLLEKYPNIIHPSTPRSPQWSLSLRCPHQDPIHPPLLTHMRHMPRRIVLSPEQAFHMCVFLNRSVLQEGVVSISPNPQAGGPSLVGCPWLLIQFIRSYPPYRRPFLYPQREDAPCRGQLILLINNPVLRRIHSCRRKIYLKSYCHKKRGTSYFIIILAYYLTHMEKHKSAPLEPSGASHVYGFSRSFFYSYSLYYFLPLAFWFFPYFTYYFHFVFSFPFPMDDIMMLIVTETVLSLIRSLMSDELKFIWKVPFKGLNAV